ncbi:hypothetical protein K1X13_16030 [Nocardioides sp. WL0053]|uniref:RNA polymerase sigma factor 70 region 4 type 2 domain-containing protein n=1 Tax=Nocardioides jiangsuensis TaxID=2866161 RepID=A0ABS7RRW8_9ACTN|nr:sigma factor-like helix-turn-helix DNA-binding protein [Nocardioides jiangsuensis]MBY9076342.1 hypothetical protein [Nocardioides jiangsuensis]
MAQEEEFDSFYLGTRRALVLQAFALTGDLAAAQSAVRDAYVAAWHHWRKVSSYPDPQDWVRPRAWQLAQRRHTARLWHRTKDISADDRAVLDALHKLPVGQRRALLLIQLAGVPMADAARELNWPQEVAERNLQAASANLAVALDTDSAGLRARLLSLAGAASQATLPRASIVRRAGRKRRRSHSLVATATVVFLAVASGAFAHEPTAEDSADAPLLAPPSGSSGGQSTGQVTEERSTLPSATDLLTAGDVDALGKGQRWRVVRTHDNTDGDGINTVCQQARFADPDGLSAMVREFKASGSPRRSAIQTMEISASREQAEDAYATTVGWYAGCPDGRLQLRRTLDVRKVGDQATVLELQSRTRPTTSYSVAVAQVGQVVTSTVGTTVRGDSAPAAKTVGVLATSARAICERAGEGGCAAKPRTRFAPPPPSGEEAGILATVDLPPIAGLDEPWAATEPTGAARNPSETTCDRASFKADGATRTRTRTFLVPGERLPPQFGLSETYGTFRTSRAAERFLDEIRGRFDACEDRDLATQVLAPRTLGSAREGFDASTWQLETEVSDSETVRFDVGFVRVGKTVAQLTFAPAGSAEMTPVQFRDLVLRAADRLRELA